MVSIKLQVIALCKMKQAKDSFAIYLTDKERVDASSITEAALGEAALGGTALGGAAGCEVHIISWD